jgi:hypothetical protein
VIERQRRRPVASARLITLDRLGIEQYEIKKDGK